MPHRQNQPPGDMDQNAGGAGGAQTTSARNTGVGNSVNLGTGDEQVPSKGQSATRAGSPHPSQQEFAGSKPSARAEGSGRKAEGDPDLTGRPIKSE
jgi:hypothetical protein